MAGKFEGELVKYFDVTLFEGGFFPGTANFDGRFEGVFHGRDGDVQVVEPTLGKMLNQAAEKFRLDVEGDGGRYREIEFPTQGKEIIIADVGIHSEEETLFSAYLEDNRGWSVVLSHRSMSGLLRAIAEEVVFKDLEVGVSIQ